ncbi:LamG-like jellyroll fold domain-containing protein [Mesorhizobium caraganae]|uniref:LamG-like jellyroll fold domain-containing protein n=1 Tax=Mesorhizobium caraganae TaxID=483206 RepID=UPI003ECDE05A
MARSGSGGHYLRSTSANFDVSVLQAAYSMHCWARSTVAPNGGSLRPCVGYVGGGGGQIPQNILLWDHTSGGFTHAAQHRRSGGTYDTAQTATVPSTNTWYSFGVAFDSSTLKVYLNGVNETTDSSVGTSNTTASWLTVLGQVNSAGALDGGSQFSNGEVAEVAVWKAPLDAAEFNALAKAFSPRHIRPASLVAYLPLVRHTQDLFGLALDEINSPTVTDHPRVIG